LLPLADGADATGNLMNHWLRFGKQSPVDWSLAIGKASAVV
jgi:hypothetical protein